MSSAVTARIARSTSRGGRRDGDRVPLVELVARHERVESLARPLDDCFVHRQSDAEETEADADERREQPDRPSAPSTPRAWEHQRYESQDRE